MSRLLFQQLTTDVLMLGFGSRILILAAGLLAGYALAPSGPHEEAVDEEAAAAARADRPMTDQPAGRPGENPSTCPPEPAGAENAGIDEPVPERSLSALPETRLPQKYRNIVRPRSYGSTTLAEWYSAFIAEDRDDAWATPVEAGIEQAVAVSGVQGIHSEYIACRSSRCTVAGYVDPTIDFNSCNVGSWIARARLIDSDLGITCQEETIGGLQRFVVFIESERPR